MLKWSGLFVMLIVLVDANYFSFYYHVEFYRWTLNCV